jgi:UDP-N-acetyl-2-amino-2-deoxyglucuronate dehydrogenase
MSRAALIGLGMVTRTYADAFRNSGTCELAGVCARSEASRERFLPPTRTSGARAMTVEEIAADPGIDFAILTTPPNARAEIVGRLAAAGKPILMEKPVERTLAGATRLVELCEARACRSASCSSTGRGRWWGSFGA